MELCLSIIVAVRDCQTLILRAIQKTSLREFRLQGYARPPRRSDWLAMNHATHQYGAGPLSYAFQKSHFSDFQNNLSFFNLIVVRRARTVRGSLGCVLPLAMERKLTSARVPKIGLSRLSQQLSEFLPQDFETD